MDGRDPETYAIIGAAIEVHSTLGCGFLERVYQEALAREFSARRIPFDRESALEIRYKGQPLPTRYRPDFVCYGAIIVEVKAATDLTRVDQAQILNYLKASTHPRALLFNFGARSLQHQRFIFSSASSA